MVCQLVVLHACYSLFLLSRGDVGLDQVRADRVCGQALRGCQASTDYGSRTGLHRAEITTETGPGVFRSDMPRSRYEEHLTAS